MLDLFRPASYTRQRDCPAIFLLRSRRGLPGPTPDSLSCNPIGVTIVFHGAQQTLSCPIRTHYSTRRNVTPWILLRISDVTAGRLALAHSLAIIRPPLSGEVNGGSSGMWIYVVSARSFCMSLSPFDTDKYTLLSTAPLHRRESQW